VVTLYGGLWHELEYDSMTRKPYLRVARADIHKFDRESVPSDNEHITESSDEEPPALHPVLESSSDKEPM
jgi:hypothetical protein